MDDYSYHVNKFKNPDFYEQHEEYYRRNHRMNLMDIQQYEQERPDPPIIDEDTEMYCEYQLIPNQLILTIYEEGFGLTPSPGSFINLLHQISIENSPVNIAKTTTTFLYGRGKMIPGLELGLSMVQERGRGRLFISSNLAYGEIGAGPIPPNSNLIIDFQVQSISNFPHNSDRELQLIFQEILHQYSRADECFALSKFEEALDHYGSAMKHILSKKFIKELKSSKGDYQSKGKEKKVDNSEFINMVEVQTEKIALKAMEAALINQQYYTVIKWGYSILLNPKHCKSERALMARARAYIELNEFQNALKDLKMLRMVHPQYQAVDKQLDYLEEKKKQYNIKFQKLKEKYKNTLKDDFWELNKPKIEQLAHFDPDY